MALSPIKRYLKKGLRQIGLELRRVSPKHTPPRVVSDPVEAMSRIRSGESVAVEASLSRCVMFNGFSLGTKGWHPLLAAAREQLAGHSGLRGSMLERYFSTWQPTNALEALIGATEGPEELTRWPPYVIHVPWLESSPAERKASLERILISENAQFGEPTLSVSDGYGLQGPVTQRKAWMEHRRLVQLLDSIQKYGFQRSLGDPRAQILIRSGDVRFRVSHGHHRVAVLRALGHDRVPVVPTMLIDRDYVDHWPQVYRSVWTRRQALAYFDHHFDFDGLAWARARGLEPPDAHTPD